MKNRNIPFGYQYQNGSITVHPVEAETVRQIYSEYLNGSSLLNIAKLLNDEHIEYLPGVTGWNKARLSRILDDERYLGNECYPAIIDADIRNQAQCLKAERNTQKETDRTADIFKLGVPVFCPECGHAMSRRHDSRNKCKERWICQNPDCKRLIIISDSDLLGEITNRINQLIRYPEKIQYHSHQSEPSLAVRRLENEIHRTIEGFSFDKSELRKKLLECVSLKYQDIDSEEHITDTLKAEFQSSKLLTNFSAELFGKTVKSILINEDGTVHLILLNGQQIGKEKNHDSNTDSTAKNCTIYSANGSRNECNRSAIPAETCSCLLPCVNQ